MIRQLRVTVRSLLRTPGYTAAFVLTLGLGIGLNTAIFSVINGVLLAPLPYPDADRIMYVQQPARAPGIRCGALDMLSRPPETTTRLVPATMLS